MKNIKILSGLLILTLSVSCLFGCNKSDSPKDENTSNTQTTASSDVKDIYKPYDSKIGFSVYYDDKFFSPSYDENNNRVDFSLNGNSESSTGMTVIRYQNTSSSEVLESKKSSYEYSGYSDITSDENSTLSSAKAQYVCAYDSENNRFYECYFVASDKDVFEIEINYLTDTDEVSMEMSLHSMAESFKVK